MVALNKNQLNRLNGYYEVDAYQSTLSLYPKPLNDILNVDLPRKISYVKFEFLTEKKLLVNCDLDGVVQQEVIKEKAKHGGFYIHKRWGAFRIPLLFWTQWNEGQRLFLGNDDNLIFDNFKDGRLMLFGF